MTPPPTPITNRLRKAQGNTGATLHLLHRIGRVELYARQRQGQPLDYAVVRLRVVGHGATPSEALTQVRNELHRRMAESQRVLTWDTGLDLGFTPDCLRAFCLANKLPPQGYTTVADLRRTVAQHHAANWPHYARHLRRVGIHLNPTPPTL